MTTLAWISALGLIMAAPAAIIGTHATVDARGTPAHAATEDPVLAQATLLNGAAEGNLRAVVVHTGLATHATFQMEGDNDRSVRLVQLQPGRNVLLDEMISEGQRSLTLQMLLSSGSTSADVAECPDGVLEVVMRTTFNGTSFGIKVGERSCVPDEA